MKINITDEQISEIVITDLKTMLASYKEEGNDKMISSILHVLQIYMKIDDFLEIKKQHTHNSTVGDIVIEEIVDDGDMSVMTFNVPDHMKNMLISEGFKYLLMKSTAGNLSDDEILDKLGVDTLYQE